MATLEKRDIGKVQRIRVWYSKDIELLFKTNTS